MNVVAFRGLTRFALGLTLLSLTSCSLNKTIAPQHDTKQQALLQSQQKALDAHLKQTALITQQVAQLKRRLEQDNKKSQQDAKAIPSLITQSDEALRTTEEFNTQQSKNSQTSTHKSIDEKRRKAQKLADQKASQLVAMRLEMETIAQRATELKSQIKDLTAQKQAAERLAQSEADEVKQLQQAKETRVAGQPEYSDRKASLKTGMEKLNSAPQNLPNQHKRIAHRHNHSHI